jgi:transcriptional regulator with XRE-family HTH domain
MERATRAEWSKRVARWRASGLTAAEFAQRAGLAVGTLRWWSSRLNRLPQEPARAGALSPLTFVEMTGAVRAEPFDVALTSGVRLRVPQDFDAAALVRLLDVLRER